MSAAHSVSIRPALTSLYGALSRLSGGRCARIARYFSHRSAIAQLRELDDGALGDIGLARSQIEAAVHGFVTRPDRATR